MLKEDPVVEAMQGNEMHLLSDHSTHCIYLNFEISTSMAIELAYPNLIWEKGFDVVC